MKQLPQFCLISLLLTLAACGGGGGDTTKPTKTPAYTGSTTLMTLGSNQVNPIVEHLLQQADGGALKTTTATTSAPSLGQKVLAGLKKAHQGGKRQTAAVVTDVQNCAGGGTVTVTQNLDANGEGTYKMVFASCLEDGLLQTGTVDSTIAANISQLPEKLTISLTVDLQQTDNASGSRTHLTGFVDVVEIAETNTSVTTSNLMLTDLDTNKSVYQKDYVTTLVADDSFYPLTAQVTMQGALYFSDLGRVNVTTVTPLTLSVNANPKDTFINGELLLTGDMGSKMKIEFLNGLYSGKPMSIKVSVGNNIEGVYQFEYYQAKAASGSSIVPVITYTNNAPVQEGGWVFATADNSEVPEGKFASVFWRITQKPEGSVATISYPDSPYLSFQADKAGTYIVQLVVSDMVNVAETSFEINVVAP